MPYQKPNGTLWYLVFNSNHDSNVLITGTPSTIRTRIKWADDLFASALVPVIRINRASTGVQARKLLSSLENYDGTPCVLIIEEMDSLLSGIRTDTGRIQAMSKFKYILDHGADHGVHTILFQTADDSLSRELRGIIHKFNTIMSTGRLTPIASQMIYNSGFGTSVPDSSRIVGWVRDGSSGILRLPK
jgi:hypothetical protein